MYFSHICHFRPMTQPTKSTNFRPIPNPTRGSTQPTDNSDVCPYRRDQGTSRSYRRSGKVHQQSPTDGAPPAVVLTAQCTHSCRQRQRNCRTWGSKQLCVGSVDTLVHHSNCGRYDIVSWDTSLM